jgi:hypothetical protein
LRDGLGDNKDWAKESESNGRGGGHSKRSEDSSAEPACFATGARVRRGRNHGNRATPDPHDPARDERLECEGTASESGGPVLEKELEERVQCEA